MDCHLDRHWHRYLVMKQRTLLGRMKLDHFEAEGVGIGNLSGGTWCTNQLCMCVGRALQRNLDVLCTCNYLQNVFPPTEHIST